MVMHTHGILQFAQHSTMYVIAPQARLALSPPDSSSSSPRFMQWGILVVLHKWKKSIEFWYKLVNMTTPSKLVMIAKQQTTEC